MSNNLHQSALWSVGLIGIGLIIIQGFLTSTSLNATAFIAICAFALAIPILTCNTLVKFAKAKKDVEIYNSIPEILFYAIGIVSAFIGITAAFWHINIIAGVIFR